MYISIYIYTCLYVYICSMLCFLLLSKYEFLKGVGTCIVPITVFIAGEGKNVPRKIELLPRK